MSTEFEQGPIVTPYAAFHMHLDLGKKKPTDVQIKQESEEALTFSASNGAFKPLVSGYLFYPTVGDELYAELRARDTDTAYQGLDALLAVRAHSKASTIHVVPRASRDVPVYWALQHHPSFSRQSNAPTWVGANPSLPYVRSRNPFEAGNLESLLSSRLRKHRQHTTHTDVTVTWGYWTKPHASQSTAVEAQFSVYDFVNPWPVSQGTINYSPHNAELSLETDKILMPDFDNMLFVLDDIARLLEKRKEPIKEIVVLPKGRALAFAKMAEFRDRLRRKTDGTWLRPMPIDYKDAPRGETGNWFE